MENIILSDEDWDHFLQTMKNPPEPNEKLKEAIYKFNLTTKKEIIDGQV